jgi:hypothetical protein
MAPAKRNLAEPIRPPAKNSVGQGRLVVDMIARQQVTRTAGSAEVIARRLAASSRGCGGSAARSKRRRGNSVLPPQLLELLGEDAR